MRVISWLYFILVLLGIFAGNAFAQSFSDVNEGGLSLEWQRLDLEEKLNRRIIQAVSGAVTPDRVVITTRIVLRKGEKNVGIESQSDGAKDIGTSTLLSKLDMNAPFLPSGPAGTESEYDIFGKIASVTVNVLFDVSVPDEKQEVFTKIIKTVVAQVGPAEPAINFEKMSITMKTPEEPWTLKRWALEFSMPAALLVVTLLMAMALLRVAGTLVKGYQTVESKKITLMEASGAREEAALQVGGAEAKADLGEVASAAGPVVASSGDEAHNGIKQFQALLKSKPDQATDLVKQWIATGGAGASDALTVLPGALETHESLLAMKKLSSDDRKEWRKYLHNPKDAVVVARAHGFVSLQITEAILTPALDLGAEIKGQLSELKMREISDLVTAKPEFAAVLANILPAQQAVSMFSFLSPEQTNQTV